MHNLIYFVGRTSNLKNFEDDSTSRMIYFTAIEINYFKFGQILKSLRCVLQFVLLLLFVCLVS